MNPPDSPIKDAPISNSVNHDAIKEVLKKDHHVNQFSTLGTKFLEETERPNIITFAQFEPFIPLFNIDKERIESDKAYRSDTQKLYDAYIHNLGINIYQPTIVVRSAEDRTELYHLNRVFTRIKSDIVDGNARRDTVPASIARNSSVTRDNLLLDASIHDLGSANQTPEMITYFQQLRVESAILDTKFIANNLNPEKRNSVVSNSEVAETEVSSPSSMILLDDDD